MIRKMQSQDIAAVVKIHADSFPNFFLTVLGERFLALYYANVQTAREGVCLVFVPEDGRVAGFAVGAASPRLFYSNLLKSNCVKFMLASVGAALKRPAIIPRLFRALTYSADVPEGDDVAGLFSLAVLPEGQKQGGGKALVEAFAAECRRRGVKKIYLTTDAVGNDPVNRFYIRQGFRLEKQYATPEKRVMNKYWLDVEDYFAGRLGRG